MGDKMRTIAIAVAALFVGATGALAAPPQVSVTIGADLQKKAVEKYGVKEVDKLAASLRKDVERELAKTDAYDGARVELTLVDAVPNRPTFEQMGRQIGLSMQSFGVGGAEIEGQVTTADGAIRPVSYKWYEQDIRWAPYRWVWSDAEWTFDRFARKLGSGQVMASR